MLDPAMSAVVKVFCMHSEPSYSQPWQRESQYSSTSSGFALPGQMLLTNAHSVECHSQVRVKRRGDDKKFLAEVLAVGKECDIALLKVPDAAFWEGVVPVAFGGLPRLQDDVIVVGYPIGGDTVSVTSGVVSRIESTSYVHGSRELLGVQIDAAINSGNSGGPVFDRDRNCVGIAFQSLSSDVAENVGWIIPTPVVSHFLTDYFRNGRITGFPILGVRYQLLESPVLKEKLGLAPLQGGIMVRAVEPTSQTKDVIEAGDVVLKFDGVDVAGDGTVAFRTGERISFGYIISQKYVGERAAVTVLRDGEVREVEVTLQRIERLVPMDFDGADPPYYIVGGFVFTVASEAYLRSEYGSYGDDYLSHSPIKLLEALHKMQSKPGEQVVLLSQILVNDANVGYDPDRYSNSIVTKVNGTPVGNLLELVTAIEEADGKYLELEVGMMYKDVIVLDCAAAMAATPAILEKMNVPNQCSMLLPTADGGVERRKGTWADIKSKVGKEAAAAAVAR